MTFWRERESVLDRERRKRSATSMVNIVGRLGRSDCERFCADVAD